MMLSIKSLRALKKRYELAVADKEETFEFQGEELLTEYAKYLIEYAEGVVNGSK